MRRRLRVTGVRVAVNNPEGGERCSIARRFFRVNLTEREPFSPSDPQDQVERGPGELRQIFSKVNFGVHQSTFCYLQKHKRLVD